MFKQKLLKILGIITIVVLYKYKSSFYNKILLEKVTNKGVTRKGKISKSFLGFVICSQTFMRANCKVVIKWSKTIFFV